MALAIDGSSPVLVSVSTNVGTSASFTPPANSLLVILWAANTPLTTVPSAPSITDSLGAHLTYTQQQYERRASTFTCDGEAAIWTAPVATSAAMTISVTSNAGGAPDHAFRILVLTDTSQPTVGASSKNGQSSGTAVPMAFTATQTGSWGFAALCDWSQVGVETAGAGTTLINSANSATSQISFGFFRRTTADGVSSSATTVNGTLPATSANVQWCAVEILAAAGAAAVSGGAAFLSPAPAFRGTPFGLGLPTFAPLPPLSGFSAFEAYAVNADFTGDGALTTTQTVDTTQAAGLSGSGTLTATTTPSVTRAADFTGSGTLTTTQVPKPVQAAALSGSGTLATTQTCATTQAAALSGSGTLTATQSAVTASASAALTGSGTLTATQTPAVSQAATLTGSGTLTAVTAPSWTVAAALTGSGTLAATDIPGYIAAAAFTGSGTLTTTQVPATAQSAALSGSGDSRRRRRARRRARPPRCPAPAL